ncbi:MAG: flagellar filament capping protein FliD [Sphingobacteriia bacterium]|nr:flagellar filament capping protein FliD [Sphingobacteriia bacterium]
MATINLGGFSNIGGRTVSSGLLSGLDTKALIEASIAAKKIPITKIEDQVKVNDSKVAAFNELKSILNTFKTAVDGLKRVTTVIENTNAFDSRNVVLTTNGSQSPSSYIGVTAKNGADINSFNLTVDNIAKSKTIMSQSFSSQTTSVTEAAGGTTAGLFSAGTFQINGKNIEINQGDSLVEIAASINSITNDTNVRASILQVAANDYRLVLQSTKTGTANDINIIDVDTETSNVTFSTTQAAEDAKFYLNNTLITRSDNVIDDAISNVTFTLYQKTPVGVTVNSQINNDNTKVKESIKTFVGAYNDFMLFASKQQERDANSKYKETAVLGGDSSLRGVIDNVSLELASVVRGLNSSPQTLGEIGIKFTDFEGDKDYPKTRNLLDIDDATLDNALATKFDGVRKIFEFAFEADSKTVLVASRSNNITVYNFNLTINTALANPNKAIASYNPGSGTVNVNFTYTGTATAGTLTAPSGSVFDGLKFVYAGDGTDNISVKLSQGVADRISNYLDGIIKTNGVIDTAIKNLKESNTRYQEEITRKNDELTKYTDKLIEKFSAVEQALAEFNSTIMYLDAQIGVMNRK